MRKMYFKIYLDKENIDTHFVEEAEAMIDLFSHFEKNSGEYKLFPIIEPIMLTEEEFKNLPEFEGF